MFNNIGEKIKKLAKFLFLLIIALYVLIGICMAISLGVQDDGNLGLIVGVVLFPVIVGVGILVAWLNTIILYAFGELVDNSKKSVVLQHEIIKCLKSSQKNEQDNVNTSAKWRCEKCGCEISGDYSFCPFCEFVERKDRLKEMNSHISE